MSAENPFQSFSPNPGLVERMSAVAVDMATHARLVLTHLPRLIEKCESIGMQLGHHHREHPDPDDIIGCDECQHDPMLADLYVDKLEYVEPVGQNFQRLVEAVDLWFELPGNHDLKYADERTSCVGRYLHGDYEELMIGDVDENEMGLYHDLASFRPAFLKLMDLTRKEQSPVRMLDEDYVNHHEAAASAAIELSHACLSVFGGVEHKSLDAYGLVWMGLKLKENHELLFNAAADFKKLIVPMRLECAEAIRVVSAPPFVPGGLPPEFAAVADHAQAETAEKITWHAAAAKINNLRRRWTGIPSVNEMARQIGCSPNTVKKAVENDPLLNDIRTFTSQKKQREIKEAAAKSEASARQRRQEDPSVSVDDILQYLRGQAKTSDRDKIDAMTPEQQRELAVAYARGNFE